MSLRRYAPELLTMNDLGSAPCPIQSTLPQPPSKPPPEADADLDPSAARSTATLDLTESRGSRAPRRASGSSQSSAQTRSSEDLHRRRRTRRLQNRPPAAPPPPERRRRDTHPTLPYIQAGAGDPHPPAAGAAGGGEESRGSRRARWIDGLLQKSPLFRLCYSDGEREETQRAF